MSSYITPAEFRAAPTAVVTTDLVNGTGVGDIQSAELARVIARASGRITSYCSQDFVASVRSKIQRVRVNRRGEIALHPGENPLVSVSALSVGYAANALTAMSASSLAAGYVETDSASFIVPAPYGVFVSTPVQHGYPGGQRVAGGRILASYTYVAGFPSTILTSSPTVGATSITVASSAGIVAGQTLSIVDGANSEQVTVTTTPTTTTVAVSALAFAHTAGTTPATWLAVHAMPDDLRQAAIYMTGALIQSRGNDSLTMGQLLTAGPAPGVDPYAMANLRMAKDILDSGGYARIR